MNKILIDMNYPGFQEDLFSLEKSDQRALLNTLSKVKKLTWKELYLDKGIRWELITSKKVAPKTNLYSFRFSQKYRGTAYREDDYLVVIGLFVNHDGAYT